VARRPAECHQAIVSATFSRTHQRIAWALRKPAAGHRFILGKRTHVAKAQQSAGRTLVLCNKDSAQQEPAQRKTRRGVPPGHVAYFFNCALTIRDSGNASQDKTRLRLFWRGVRPRIRKHRPCGTTCGWRGVNATGRHHLFPNLIRELIGRGCPRSVGPVAGAADSVAHGRVFPAVSLQGSGE
jgi:hypothetical protein